MKRSEMLRIIWEAVNELDDADHILTRIEEAGMLPPDTGKGVILGTRYMSTHLDYSQSQDNRWEPEGLDNAQHDGDDPSEA
jgi:hypothetical protein